MRKTIENLIYQMLFQVAKIIIPLITVPIVSRALGPSGVGVYNYTNSIAQYFVIFSGLGITLYGNREIARVRDSKEELSTLFWELVTLKFITTSILLFVYFISSSFSKDSLYYYVQGLTIFAVIFDISWFFMGLEDFKKVTSINLICQITSLILIINLIKQPSDVVKYIGIQGASLLISQILTWFFIKGKVELIRPKLKKVYFHLKKSLIYLIPQVSVLFYTNLNKTMLGLFTTKEAVAFYSNAQTINTMIIMLITTLDTVLLPKMSYLSANKDKKSILTIMQKTIHFQLFFSIAAMFGLISICREMVPWFFGNDFLFLNNLIPVFAPLLVVIPLGMAISRQYLLPTGKIKEYNISVIFGAIISLIISLSTISFLGIYAAVIATIISEFFVCISRLIPFIKHEKFHFRVKIIIRYLFCGVTMSLMIFILTKYFQLRPSPINTLLQVLVGTIIYMIMATLFNANPFVKKVWKNF